MKTHQEVNNHKDLLNVVDELLVEVGLDRKDLGGKMTFASLRMYGPLERFKQSRIINATLKTN